MNRPDPKPIGRIISEMIERLGMTEEMKRHKVVSLWHPMVGEGIGAYTRSVYMQGSVLHVTISSAPLKEELGYAREALRQRINAAMGEEIVSNIAIH